jgi:hypothetical protein
MMEISAGLNICWSGVTYLFSKFLNGIADHRFGLLCLALNVTLRYQLCYVIYGVSYFKDNLTSITLILTKIMKINKL